MNVTFWGVRGSIPVPGEETAKWGGNSSCVEVHGEGLPALVLDCGTGARALGKKLVRSRGRDVHLLFSHLHADHLFGFPFFLPLYTPGMRVRVGVPAYSDDEARERVGRYLSGTYHPTRLRDVPADIDFHAVRPGRRVDVKGWEVTSLRLNHPGGSVGYRIRHQDAVCAYVTDTAPFARPGEGVAAGGPPSPSELRVIEFLRGCQVVVYDTMYDHDEYLEKMTWGHSYPDYAVALCREAGVEHVVLFHHLPDATDADLDAREAKYAGHVAPRVTLAREGSTLVVGAAVP